MKRPLAVFCFTWYVVQLVGTRLPQSGLPAAAVFFLLSFIIVFLRRRFGKILLLVIFGAAFLACIAQSLYRLETMRMEAKFAGKTQTVTAKIKTASAGAFGSAVRLILPLDGRRVEVDAWLPAACGPGDEVRVTLSFGAASSYQQAKGARLSASLSEDAGAVLEVKEATGGPAYLLRRLRARASGILQAGIGRDAGKTAAAICVGDRAALPDALSRAYRRAGIGHLLAVSGMHLSVVCGALLACVPRRRAWLRFFLGTALIAGYAAFTGGAPSVLRAGLMLTLALAAPAVSRSADTPTALGFAALCLTLTNPLAAADPSLLFSLSATAGVLAASGWLSAHWPQDAGEGAPRRFLRGAAELALIGAAAAVFTLPAVMLTGGYASVWSVFAGMLTIPVLPLVLGGGLLGVLASVAGLGALANLLLWLSGVAAGYINGVAAFFSGLPFCGGYLQGAYLLTVLFVALAGGAALVVLKEKKKFFILLCAVLLCASLIGGALGAGTVKLVLLGTGASPAVVIAKGGEAAVLWKGGKDAGKLERCLERMNITNLILLCDFSGKTAARPHLTLYEPQTYCKVEESVTTGVTFSPFDGIILTIERQDGGSLCRIDAEGVRFGYTSGAPELSGEAFCVLFTGARLPKNVSCDLLLTTSAKTAAEAGVNAKCAEGLAVFVRPGRSYQLMEVDTGGGT